MVNVRSSAAPISVALVDDYDVVLVGLAHMLEAYRDRVAVAEIDANRPVSEDVDVVLYDSFAQPEADSDELRVLIENPHARRVAVYTWNFHPDLIDSAIRKGASGYLSKTLPARDLVTALESIHGGTTVISPMPGKSRGAPGLDWPGRSEGLTERESEILALITQGKSNAEVAVTTYLSANSIKSYIRSVYRKIGVKTRTQAVLWGVEHGFKPDHYRLDFWRGDTRRVCPRPARLLRSKWRQHEVFDGRRGVHGKLIGARTQRSSEVLMILRLAISPIIVLALAWGAASQTSAQDEPAPLSTMASIGGAITPTDLLQLTLD